MPKFLKGSIEAKEYMAALRAMKGTNKTALPEQQVTIPEDVSPAIPLPSFAPVDAPLVKKRKSRKKVVCGCGSTNSNELQDHEIVSLFRA